MKSALLLFVGAGVVLGGTSTQAAERPSAISPGLPEATARIEDRCPTFSWSAVPEATGYRVAVYRVPEGDPSRAVQVIQRDLPRWALSWTPPLELCLVSGETYAWHVAAGTEDGEPAWSEAAWFEVAPPELIVTPRVLDEIVRQLAVRSAAGDGGAAAAGSGHPVRPRGPLPAGSTSIPIEDRAASYFSVGSGGAVTAGAVSATSFAGDGSNVTNVDAATLGGNAASAFALFGHLHDERYFTETELGTSGGGGGVHWDNVLWVPADLLDGDDDTTYTAGAGLTLAGTTFSLGTFGDSPSANTITALDATDDVGYYTSITIGADGLGLISYYDNTNGDLKVAHCSNVNCTAATISTLDSAGDVGAYTSVAIGADGLGLISYYDDTNDDLKVAHCDNLECTSATLATIDSTNTPGTHTSLTIGADGLGLLSYYHSSGTELKVAHCDNAACTSATLTVLDSANIVGTYTSVTLGADGLGLISYYDQTNANLKVAHCTDVNCTTATITTLDSVGEVGQYTSVAIGADGLGLISYYDNTNDDLKVAHCSNVNCTTATITTLDGGGADGLYASVTTGADGLGLISHRDETDHDLVVAHCRDVLCAAATHSTLDGANSVGAFTSVTIGADGLPLISYYDSTDSSLKVAHCANALCVPYFRRR